LTGEGVGGRHTIFYRNDPSAVLVDDGDHGLPGVNLSDAEWGDYDRDGDVDLVLTGEMAGGGPRMARVYANDGSGEFTQVASLSNLYRSSCAWGDIDLDGDLDLALCGYDGTSLQTRIYENAAGGFVALGFSFPGVREGSVSLVDVDLDGDLDFFLVGADWSARYARVYENTGREGPASAVAAAGETGPVPGIALYGNAPNPFNPCTQILYRLAAAGPVRLAIYDAGGSLVCTLVDGWEEAGRHATVWKGVNAEGRPVASGIYLARLVAGERAATRKMVLAR
jgi:hypothetical protein